ncbi:MAG: ABC transporter substrate-binding protein [Beijerinckiaceae bacterium]
MIFSRRHALALLAATPLAGASQAAARRMRILLNTSYCGPVSFFLLAQQRGYFREARLDVAFSEGGGAAAVVPQVAPRGYQAGYGDMCALIELVARGEPDAGPVAIYTTFNTTPLTIAVEASGPIRAPKDLEGRTVSGHAQDAALLTFDVFAAATGIDPAKVRRVTSHSDLGGQVASMLKGGSAQGVFGFVNTIIASVTPLGIDPARLRFINYADYVPDMYGNTLFVPRSVYRNSAPELRKLVRAVNRGLADTAASPDAAIDALVRAVPGVDRAVDRTRLVGTLKAEMANPEGARIGIGDMDDARLARLIERIVSVKKLPRKPRVDEVFDRSFLPPDAERIRTLAAR